MQLGGSHVFITGASRGIGAALAREFSSRGARVSVAARSESALKAVAAEVGGQAFVVDLTDDAQVDELIPRVEAEAGPIDILANNAGMETTTPFNAVDPDTIRQLARLNVEAPLLLTRAVLPPMLERGRGHLFFTSSLAGTGPFPGLAAYCGSKAAITNFAATLRMELKDTAIKTTVVAPGPVDTDMWDHLEDSATSQDMLKRLRLLRLIPMASPEKLARLSVDAVELDKPYLGLPKRLGANHLFNNLPGMITGLILKGVVTGPTAQDG